MVNKISSSSDGTNPLVPVQQKKLPSHYSAQFFRDKNGKEITLEDLSQAFKTHEFKLFNYIKNHHLDPLPAVCLINNLFKLEENQLDSILKFMESQNQFPPYLGTKFLDHLISFFSQKNLIHFTWDEDNSSLLAIFLSILVNQDEEGAEHRAIYQNFLSQARDLKDESLGLQFCMQLANHPSSAENKRELLALLSSHDNPDFRKSLVLAGSLLHLNEKSVATVNSFKDLEEKLEKAFNKPFPELNWSMDAYYQTFGKMRDPFAFVSFFSKIIALDEDKVTTALRTLIEKSRGDYAKERYKTMESEHFSACVTSRYFDADHWMKGTECTANTLEEKSLLDTLENSHNYVLQDTDRLEDLLLFSKECDSEHYPRFDEDFFTEALLGLILNSKNRLLVLRDKSTGRIVAFRMLKLYLKIKEPVLCLEAYQSIDPENEGMKNLLQRFAEKRGADLQLALYSENSPEKVMVHSLKDTIPIDYTFYNNSYSQSMATKFET